MNFLDLFFDSLITWIITGSGIFAAFKAVLWLQGLRIASYIRVYYHRKKFLNHIVFTNANHLLKYKHPINTIQDLCKKEIAKDLLYLEVFINRNLLIGLNRGKAEATLDDVISTTTPIDSITHRGIYADIENSDLTYKRVSEGSSFPRVFLKTKEKAITLEKIGLQFDSTYESLKLTRVSTLANMIQLLGFKLGRDLVTEALLTLLNGDGNSNPAGSVSVATSGTITFADLLNLQMAFENFEPEILVGNKDTVKKVLLVAEFRDPLIGAKFLNEGNFTTPFGNVIKINPNFPNNKLLAFNKKAGVEMLELKSMSLIESEKLIDKQFEKSVISKVVGFNKLFSDSAFVLNI